MQPSATAPARPAMATAETIMVSDTTVACDGGGGALGHPRVFLKLVDGQVTCPYCSRHYRLAPVGNAGGGGRAA